MADYNETSDIGYLCSRHIF